MHVESLSLFAQISSRLSPGRTVDAIGHMIVFFGPVLLGAMILSVIVATLFHLFSVFLRNPQIAFVEVFPHVFYVIFIIGIIWRILQYLPEVLTFVGY